MQTKYRNVVMLVVVLVMAVFTVPAMADIVPAPLTLGEYAIQMHPAMVGPIGSFNVHDYDLEGEGGGDVPVIQSLEFQYTEGLLAGSMFRSVVLASEQGPALMFLYQLELSPTSSIVRDGVISGFSWVDIMDCGLIRPGPPPVFMDGDLIAMERYADSDYVNVAFRMMGYGQELLPGQTSAWMYLITDADNFVVGTANFEGCTADAIVPHLPEPASASILLLGAIALLRRRKK